MLVRFLKPSQCCYANRSSSQSPGRGQVWSRDFAVIGEDGADVDKVLCHGMISQAQADSQRASRQVTTCTDVKGQR